MQKNYLYDKDPYEAKYQFLIKKREDVGTNHFNDSKCFIEHSNKKRKILIVFDGMITDMLSNIKLNPKVTELFIRGRMLNISIALLYNLILVCQKILD